MWSRSHNPLAMGSRSIGIKEARGESVRRRDQDVGSFKGDEGEIM